MTTTMTTPAATRAGTWTIDAAHTDVEFAVKHLMISRVKGRFTGVSGTIEMDAREPSRWRLEVRIDAASLDTGNADRDAHLRSGDFFDVETYPALTYRSRRVERVGEGRFRVVGDLTIRDRTNEVVLEVEEQGRAADPWGGERAGFRATAVLDRREFGLTWNQALEAGGVVVGHEVGVSLEVQAVRSGN